MKLTKIKVDRLPIPRRLAPGRTAQTRHYDDVLKGFGVRVTSGGCKAFFVEKRVGRKLHWITLGHYPALTVEQARREAQKLLGKIASGIDPIAEKQETIAKQITLQEVFEDYLAARKSLKPTTLKDYHQFMNRAFCDWRSRPLSRIAKDMVVKRHAELGQRSRARADGAMRLLRALFNFAAASYDDTQGRSLFPENPVRRLSQTRAWY